MPDITPFLPRNGWIIDNSLTPNWLPHLSEASTNLSSWRYRGKRAGKKVTSHQKSTTYNIQPLVSDQRPRMKKIFPYRSHRTLIEIKLQPNNKQFTAAFYSKLALWNARSIKAKKILKTTTICDHVASESIDILVLTETWLTGNNRDNSVIADISNSLPDYEFYNVPRAGRGGGVGVILRKGYSVTHYQDNTYRSFEYADLCIKSGSTYLRLVSVYRPPPSRKNGLTTSLFIDEFSSFTENLIISPGKLLIAGDFNFHIDDPTDHDARVFLDLLDSFGLQQHITTPTHNKGHTLDLLINRVSDNELVSSVKTSFELPSDHAIISSQITVPRPKRTKSLITCRHLRGVNNTALIDDLYSSSLLVNPSSDLDQLVHQYNEDLRFALDRHAPLVSRTVVLRPHAKWFNESLRTAKRERRRLERKWKSTLLESYKEIYIEQCKKYHALLVAAKSSYHENELKSCEPKRFFRSVDKLVNGKRPPLLPTSHNQANLAELFSQYFTSKIDELRISLQNASSNSVQFDSPLSCSSELSKFHPVDRDHVLKLIINSPTKTCMLDPLPTSLVKTCADPLVPPITDIINTSLALGDVPPSLKTALISPVIKKPNLDRNILSNYRPISNLPFISKILERCAAQQLHSYLQENHLYSKFQSAYRKHHSTETALLRVHNDILVALDSGFDTALLMIDFSSAFDTIDHNTLLKRLQIKFGITGVALKWFESYLNQRAQSVIITTNESSRQPLSCGVPQGSVLGPLLFTLYASPIEDIVKAHSLNGMFYADDSQLYLTLKPSTFTSSIQKLEDCVRAIKSWSTDNYLMFNDGKTEIVHIHSKFTKSPSIFPGIHVGETHISPTEKTRDLGVITDNHLSMVNHVGNVCKVASQAIYNLGKIRQYLSKSTCERLVHAFITSRLDACNGLLYGLPSTLINKLQRIQNIAARLITRTKRSEHITPILYKLHWLPVQQRIRFKILLLTYKAIHGLAPTYISQLLIKKDHVRSLRSSTNAVSLFRPRSRTTTYGDRAFSISAPTLWNKLPKNIKEAESLVTFKSLLKTYLFKEHFIDIY